MDSQPVMLEPATGEGSNSSDSIVNLSQSGASGISTISSSSNSSENDKDQDLVAQIHQLQEEKKLLEGRIRGYKTLSDLLVESRKENQKLKTQLMALQAAGDKPTVSNPPSLQASAGPGNKDLPQNMDIGKLSLNGTGQKYSSLGSVPSATAQTSVNARFSGAASTSALNTPEKGPPSSLQETSGPPQDPEETKVVKLPATRYKPVSGETTPMQESLGPVSNASFVGSGSRDNLTSSPANGAGKLPPLSAESPEALQFDSDKYEEATYEKVGLRLGMSGSMYAAGGSNHGESRHTDFPSLSSGLSGGMVHPSHHSANSLNHPPFMGMMHQSYIGQASDAGNDIAAQLESISEQLNSEPGDSSPAIAFQMHEIAERIARVEQKKEDQKKLIQTLMAENHTLKQQVKTSSTSYQAQTVALREENTRLMQQLKRVSQGSPGQDATLTKSPSPGSDWVHVERPLNTGDDTAGSEQVLVDRVRTLEQEKAQLHRANMNWKAQWDQMEQQHKAELNELRSKLAVTEQELTTCRARLADQNQDIEARMLELKRRYSEEENAKEEAIHEQRMAERRCQELQDQLSEVRTQLSDTAREKQALAAELSILKARTSSQESQTGGVSGGAAARSKAALEAEIAMLRQQLNVYLEDFEHERVDRTTAQQARDEARRNVESLSRTNQQLQSQIRHMQRQIKDRDDTISTTLRQNETLQRQISDFKKKLAAEWEQKQGLQRALSMAQQQQRQQTLRNPYLQPESYSATQPVYQPSMPPPNYTQSAPYFGRQNSQPVTRMGAVTMSPEHLPGAWTCSSCTYVNYPGRTVCEMCGIVNNPRNQAEPFGFVTNDLYCSGEHQLLMSRDGQRPGGGAAAGGNNDLVVDSGLDPAGISPH